MSIELVMPSNHLILCCLLLLLPSVFPSIRVFSNELALCISWPKYYSFSFSISPSSEYSGLIPSGLTGLISLQSRELTRVFASTTVWKHQKRMYYIYMIEEERNRGWFQGLFCFAAVFPWHLEIWYYWLYYWRQCRKNKFGVRVMVKFSSSVLNHLSRGPLFSIQCDVQSIVKYIIWSRRERS